MLALGEEGGPAKSLLRQLTCSRRRATRAAAAMLGGRRVRPLQSQQEAMKAGKELLLERSNVNSGKFFSSSPSHQPAHRYSSLTLQETSADARQVACYVVSSLPNTTRASQGTLQVSWIAMRSRDDAWEIIISRWTVGSSTN
jgi:hypothetical protein